MVKGTEANYVLILIFGIFFAMLGYSGYTEPSFRATWIPLASLIIFSISLAAILFAIIKLVKK